MLGTSLVRIWLYGSVVAFILAAIGFVWIWNLRGEERAIRALPQAERQSLYRRTLEDLRAVCGPSHGGDLSAHCRRQARFILQFPDCDDACQSLARKQLDMPTR